MNDLRDSSWGYLMSRNDLCEDIKIILTTPGHTGSSQAKDCGGNCAFEKISKKMFQDLISDHSGHLHIDAKQTAPQ